jgi:hypothetical protein
MDGRNFKQLWKTVKGYGISIVLNFQVMTKKGKNLLIFQDFENCVEGIFTSVMPFDCPICMNEIKEGEGIVLQDCLHMFCKYCTISWGIETLLDFVCYIYTFLENALWR